MAITSSTDICKLSLDLLQGGSVSDITAASTSIEEICERWYDHTRRKLLRQHPWNFAVKRAELAASTDVPLFGATAQFPVPADFLRLLQVVDSEGGIIGAEEYFFEARSIMFRYDEETTARILYITDEEDVTKFDDLFIDLLSVEIALSIAYLVTQNNANIDRLNTIRKNLMSAAKSIDGQEHPPISRKSSINRRSRMGLGLAVIMAVFAADSDRGGDGIPIPTPSESSYLTKDDGSSLLYKDDGSSILEM